MSIREGALLKLRTWIVIALLFTTAFLLNHEQVRLATIWQHFSYTPHLLSVLLVLSAVVLAVREQQRPAHAYGSRATRMLLLLVSFGVAGLIAFIATANIVGLLNTRDRAPATIERSHSTLHVRGTIDRALPSRIEQQLAGQNIQLLIIESSGGDNAAARLLASTLKKRSIPVRTGRYCASACALLWVSTPGRQAYHYSRIGLHRSHLGLGRQSRGVVASALTQQDEQLANALSIAGFPSEVIDKALSQPPERVLWLTASELERIGVQLQLVN